MTEIADVFAKLRHGAGAEFSMSLKPAECALLLQALDDEFVSELVKQPCFIGVEIVDNTFVGCALPAGHDGPHQAPGETPC